MKLADTIDMVLSDLMRLVCLLAMLVCTYVNSHPLLHVTRRVPNGTVVVVPWLWPMIDMNHAIVSEALYLCYTGTLKSLPPRPQDYIRNMAYMHCLYICVFCHLCVLCVLLFTVVFCMPSGSVR